MAQRQPAADLILHGGKVLTVDPQDSIGEAVAVSGQRIQAVGSDGDVLPLSGPNTHTIDLQGHTLIPGIIDIHAHMDREGLRQVFPSLAGARTIPQV
ncbi:MAG: amidohydrolase, partial [Dehalococcoidia bacterium]